MPLNMQKLRLSRLARISVRLLATGAILTIPLWMSRLLLLLGSSRLVRLLMCLIGVILVVSVLFRWPLMIPAPNPCSRWAIPLVERLTVVHTLVLRLVM